MERIVVKTVFCLICPLVMWTTLNAETDETEFVRSPVIMCAPQYDACTILETTVGLHLDGTNIVNGSEMVFDRKLGPFTSARVTLFNPPNPYLRHHFNYYGQIKSIVSTSEVQAVSFNAGTFELERIKQIFEKGIDNILFERIMKSDEMLFRTQSSTASGWHMMLSVKRIETGGCLFRMEIFRKQHVQKGSPPMPQIELDI